MAREDEGNHNDLVSCTDAHFRGPLNANCRRSFRLIDPGTGRQVATVDEGGTTGHEVVGSPDGKRAFVPIYGNSGVGMPGTDGSTLVVIELGDRKVIHTIDFGHGVRPHCALFGPKDGLLYVTTELEQSARVIDTRSLTHVG